MSCFESRKLPDFGGPKSCPELLREDYQARLDALSERMSEAALDILMIYADREHAANMSYLIGFEPRFEEALFCFRSDGRHLLIVGNESLAYVPYFPLELHTEIFQEFSLLGQSRSESRPLKTLLQEAGVEKGCRVGTVGWKYFESDLLGEEAIEVPAYLVDALRFLVGTTGVIVNATALFMHPVTGLRQKNEVRQIARFEYAATWTSTTVRRASLAIQEGVSEQQIESFLHGGGLPRSCHPMVSFGDKVKTGLSSPSGGRARLGDAWMIAYGVTGALNCRAGLVAKRNDDVLPGAFLEFFDAYAQNYFDVVATWYAALKIGRPGGDIFEIVNAKRNSELFHFAVNPGHSLHLDEWLHSPFRLNSSDILLSGQALQMDIIPVSTGPFCYTNVEDGVILADDILREELQNNFPEMYARMQERRRFMIEDLGLELDTCVLPLGNTPAYLTPYILEPELTLVSS
jgi:hypothetical protein